MSTALDLRFDNINAGILAILTGMKDSNNLTYFTKAYKGRLRPVNEFPSAFFWYEGKLPMGNDYLDGDLIKHRVTVAGFDYGLDLFNAYEDAELRSEKVAAHLRAEFTKWANRNLSGVVFQLQVIDMFIDPGVAPFQFGGGGLMAAGGVELLLVYRQDRGV